MILYYVPLLPYIERLRDYEVKRAERGRSPRTRKVRNIPVRFVSVNRMYPIHPHARTKRLSKEGEIFKDYVYECMELHDKSMCRCLPTCDLYECTYVYYLTQSMLFTKSGDLRQEDVSNFLKATEDAVFDYLLEDDSQVLGISGYKRMTVGDPALVIMLSASDLDDPVKVSGDSFDPYHLLSEAESCAESFQGSL